MMAALVRRALAEACTVPVFLVLHGLESVCMTRTNLCALQYMLDMSLSSLSSSLLQLCGHATELLITLFKSLKTKDKTIVDCYCYYGRPA